MLFKTKAVLMHMDRPQPVHVHKDCLDNEEYRKLKFKVLQTG